MKPKRKSLYEKYKHFLLLLFYAPIYLLWFAYLEKTVRTHFHVIYMKIDDYIPFCEYFIIPYLLWFLYVAATVFYVGFTDRTEFYKLCAFLFTGMTLFLIISTIYPNGHFLRPTTFENTNIFTELCAWLYKTDTATNLFPSIHVYNSIGAHLGVIYSKKLKDNKPIRTISFVLMISIILSTVFLKQHSVFDLITGLLTAFVMYLFVYVPSINKNPAKEKSKKKVTA